MSPQETPQQRHVLDPDEIEGCVIDHFFHTPEFHNAREAFLAPKETVESGCASFRNVIEEGRKASGTQMGIISIDDSTLLGNLPVEPHIFGCNINGITNTKELVSRLEQGRYPYPLSTQLTTQTKDDLIGWLNRVMILQEWDLNLFTLVAGLNNFRSASKPLAEADKLYCHQIAADVHRLFAYFRMENVSFLPEPYQSYVKHYAALFEKTYSEFSSQLRAGNTTAAAAAPAAAEPLMITSYKMYVCLARVISSLLHGMLGKDLPFDKGKKERNKID